MKRPHVTLAALILGLGSQLSIQASSIDLVWSAQATVVAGQEVVLPYQAKWPKEQALIVGFGVAEALPPGMNCTLEVHVQRDLLRALPCAKFTQLEKPIRVVPAMKVQLRLYNAEFPSKGVQLTLKNRLQLEVNTPD